VDTLINKTTGIAILILLLAILFLAFISIREMIGPLVIAGLMAYILNPVVTLLKNYTKISHRLSVSIVYFLSLALLSATLLIATPIVIQQAKNLTGELLPVWTRIEETLAEPIQILDFELTFDSIIDEFQGSTRQFLNPERAFRVINSATTNLVWLILILVTTFYLLLDWDRLLEWFIKLAPETYQPDIRRLLEEIKVIWQSYLRGQLILMIFVGLLSGLAAAAMGLPMAFLFGLLAGSLDLIPSVGPAVTLVVATLVAWFEGSTYLPISNTWFVILTIGAFTSIQILEGLVLQPVIIGRHVRLHPGLVFVSVLGALTLGSVLLALIIVPIIGTVGVLIRYLRCRLLEQNPWFDSKTYTLDDETILFYDQPVEQIE